MYIIVFENERGALVSEHTLFDGPLRVGRIEENEVVLPGTTVSRHHATVYLDGLTAYIADSGSSNGVLVDDQRITAPTAIDERNQIRIGEYRCYLERATGKVKSRLEGIGTAIVLPDQAHAKLVIISGPQAGREHLLFEPVTRIGRTDENDISLADVSVSRHHAQLQRQDDGSYVFVDLGSSNGTLFNGRAVTQAARIWHGARLQFGTVECMLVDPTGRQKKRLHISPNIWFGLAVVIAAILGVTVTLLLSK